MKKSLLLTLAVMMTLLLALSMAAAQNETIKIVTAQQNAKVREIASTSSALVGSLPAGQTAQVLEETSTGENVNGNATWYRVRLSNNAEGWVWSGTVKVDEVTPTPSPTPRPTLPPNPDYETITAGNVARLWQVNNWGNGMQLKVAWSPNSEQVVVATTHGLYAYDANHFEAGARLIHDFDSPYVARYAVQMGFIGDTSNLFLLRFSFDWENGGIQPHLVLETINVQNSQSGVSLDLPTLATSRRNVDGINRGGMFQMVSFTADGHQLAIIDPEGVRFFDVIFDDRTGTIVDFQEGSRLELSSQPTAASISPDGTQIAVNIGDTTYLYSLPNFDLIAQAQGGVSQYHYSADSSQITQFGGRYTTTLDAMTGAIVKEYARSLYPRLDDADLSHDSSAFAVDYGAGLELWHMGDKKPIFTIPNVSLTGIAFSPDGSQVAGVGRIFGQFTIWDTTSGEIRYQDPRYIVTSPKVSFTDNGTTLVVAGFGGLRLSPIGVDVADFNTSYPWGGVAAFNADRLLADLGIDFDYTAGSGVARFQTFNRDGSPVSDPVEFAMVSDGVGFMSPINSFAISPDGQTVVLGDRRGHITIRDGTTLAVRTTVYHSCCAVHNIVFANDGIHFVTGGKDSTIYVWTTDGQLVQKLVMPADSQADGVRELSISTDGGYVAASNMNNAYVWAVESGERFGPFTVGGGPYLTAFALHPDGKLLAIWSFGGGTISVFDIASGKVIKEIESWHSGGGLRFTPDGALLISVGYDEGIIRFWGVRRAVIPTATASLAATPLPTVTATLTATVTQRPTNTPFPTMTPLPTATATSVPVVLFQDDFENGDLSQWDNQYSVGRIVSDGSNHFVRLENDTDGYSILSLLDKSWSDYAFEASVRIEQGSPSATDLFVNMRGNADGGYGGTLDTESSAAGILAGYKGNYYDLGTVNVAQPMNQWFRVRIQTAGEQIKLYLNDVLIQSATASYSSEGNISFTVGPHTIVEIDDVKVIDLTTGS